MLNSLPGLSLTKSVVYWLEFLKPLQDKYFTLLYKLALRLLDRYSALSLISTLKGHAIVRLWFFYLFQTIRIARV